MSLWPAVSLLFVTDACSLGWRPAHACLLLRLLSTPTGSQMWGRSDLLGEGPSPTQRFVQFVGTTASCEIQEPRESLASWPLTGAEAEGMSRVICCRRETVQSQSPGQTVGFVFKSSVCPVQLILCLIYHDAF